MVFHHPVGFKQVFRFLQLAHFRLAKRLIWSVFPGLAEELEFHDIAAYIRKYASIKDRKEIITKVYESHPNKKLYDVELKGREDQNIRNTRFYLQDILEEDATHLRLRPHRVSEIISEYTWQKVCLPQIIARFLDEIVFGEGRPMHELEYTIGMNRSDYEYIGLA